MHYFRFLCILKNTFIKDFSYPRTSSRRHMAWGVGACRETYLPAPEYQVQSSGPPRSAHSRYSIFPLHQSCLLPQATEGSEPVQEEVKLIEKCYKSPLTLAPKSITLEPVASLLGSYNSQGLLLRLDLCRCRGHKEVSGDCAEFRRPLRLELAGGQEEGWHRPQRSPLGKHAERRWEVLPSERRVGDSGSWGQPGWAHPGSQLPSWSSDRETEHFPPTELCNGFIATGRFSISVLIKSVDSWARLPGFESQLCHFYLCDLGQVTWPLCASVSSSVK